jgi:hypothetical protein
MQKSELVPSLFSKICKRCEKEKEITSFPPTALCGTCCMCHWDLGSYGLKRAYVNIFFCVECDKWHPIDKKISRRRACVDCGKLLKKRLAEKLMEKKIKDKNNHPLPVIEEIIVKDD